VDFTGVTVDDAPIGTDANLSELTLSAPDGTALATRADRGQRLLRHLRRPRTSDGGEWHQG
jgi:hypothetical protein